MIGEFQMNKRQKKKQRTKAIKELQKKIDEVGKEMTNFINMLPDFIKWGDND